MGLLIEYGVPLMGKNNDGQTPLHIAFSIGSNSHQLSPSEFLLKHTNSHVDVADYNKIRPIHLTSSFSTDLTFRLLELGADHEVFTIEGQSPLMVACRTRQVNTVSILIHHYKRQNQLSLIDRVDLQGYSALHYACKSGRPETVALLLEAGANVSLKDKQRCTPLHVCGEYLDEQATWENAEKPHKGPRPKGAAYVLLTDSSRPCSSSGYYMGEDPVRIRETIRLLTAKAADTSFLTALPNSLHVDIDDWYRTVRSPEDPLSCAIRRSCEPMVSELLLLQTKLLDMKMLDLEKAARFTGDIMAEEKESIDNVRQY